MMCIGGAISCNIHVKHKRRHSKLQSKAILLFDRYTPKADKFLIIQQIVFISVMPVEKSHYLWIWETIISHNSLCILKWDKTFVVGIEFLEWFLYLFFAARKNAPIICG